MSVNLTTVKETPQTQSATNLGEVHLLGNLSNVDLRTVYHVDVCGGERNLL
jgi:hypothetical protein